MCRTILSFRIATAFEEKEWKLYQKYLSKNNKKTFREMFSTTRLYSYSSSYSCNPIRLFHFLLSLIFNTYKNILKKIINGERGKE